MTISHFIVNCMQLLKVHKYIICILFMLGLFSGVFSHILSVSPGALKFIEQPLTARRVFL